MMTVCQPWIIRSMSQSILIGIHSGGWKLEKREWTMKRNVFTEKSGLIGTFSKNLTLRQANSVKTSTGKTYRTVWF